VSFETAKEAIDASIDLSNSIRISELFLSNESFSIDLHSSSKAKLTITDQLSTMHL